MNGKFRRTAAMTAVFATVMTIVAASWLFAAATPATATSSCADIGTTWTSQTSAADNWWSSVVWGGPTGQEKFVAVAEVAMVGTRVMTSPDGITWTPQTPAANNAWRSVTWGGPTGQEKFVAVADSGTGNRVMTSTNGITWTIGVSAADNGWQSVTWGGPTGQEKFVAVAITGTGNRVMTSTNGITWTTQTTPANNNWMSVTYGGGLFVAVSMNGASVATQVMTSTNGTDWTARTSAAFYSWRSVTYGGGLFVAVASSGTGNRVMTSTNGITWTARTSAADNTWRSVTWGGPTGQEKFVAVADSGTGNRVMTSSCPLSVPDVPTVSSITAADGSLTVAFTAGTDGGSPITNYKYSVNGTDYTALNPAATTSPFTINGLTNATTYSVTIKAVNAIGDSVASNAITGTPVAPAATPTEPNNAPTPTTVAPTTTTSPTTTVATATTVPSITKVKKAESLPETGDNSAMIIVIGLLFTATGLVLTSRRRINR